MKLNWLFVKWKKGAGHPEGRRLIHWLDADGKNEQSARLTHELAKSMLARLAK